MKKSLYSTRTTKTYVPIFDITRLKKTRDDRLTYLLAHMITYKLHDTQREQQDN